MHKMNTMTRIDYVVARKRLASITTDPVALVGMDRIRETGSLNAAVMAAVDEHNISLDWLFLGKGVAHLEGCRDG
jgi:hypothetical protein